MTKFGDALSSSKSEQQSFKEFKIFGAVHDLKYS